MQCYQVFEGCTWRACVQSTIEEQCCACVQSTIEEQWRACVQSTIEEQWRACVQSTIEEQWRACVQSTIVEESLLICVVYSNNKQVSKSVSKP